MIKIDVFVRDKNWKRYISNPEKYLNKKVKLINLKKGLINSKNINFSILLTGNKEIKFLNNKFRKKNKITDVLSFPFNYKSGKNSYLGDIAISFEIVNKRSGKSNFFMEFDKMWVHGYLHLVGYDHKQNKDYKKMKKKEKLILNYLNN